MVPTSQLNKAELMHNTDLGRMYLKGRGVLKDSLTAHMWYNIASANGR